MSKKLDILLHGLDILRIYGNPEIPVTGVAYDSRRVEKGNIFVAIPGSKQDGNKFILDALARGAEVVVSRTAPENGSEAVFVQVRDPRKALAALAANYFEHPSAGVQLIGITGTNGKTTNTLLLEGILKRAGCNVGVLGTLAYRWAGKRKKASMTTPESYDLQKLFHEMRQDGVGHIVMEASSHALALGRVEGCGFRAVVFTNLSQDHLDFHATMEDYYLAKKKLFTDYLSSAAGRPVAVINLDDPYGKRLIAETAGSVWSYSVNDRNAEVWVRDAQLSPTGIRAMFSTPSGDLEIRSALLGRLNLYNLLSAATTALALQIPAEDIASGLEAVSVVDGRLQRVPVPAETGFEVVVDYAHTPDAMEKALTCLREMTRGRLICVFGCGGDRDRGKRPLMGQTAASISDLVIVTSDNPRTEEPERIIEDIKPGAHAKNLPLIEPESRPSLDRGHTVVVDRKKAIRLALSWASPGDMVFIGGKGHETYQIIGGETFPFDDRQVVLDYFRQRDA